MILLFQWEVVLICCYHVVASRDSTHGDVGGCRSVEWLAETLTTINQRFLNPLVDLQVLGCGLWCRVAVHNLGCLLNARLTPDHNFSSQPVTQISSCDVCLSKRVQKFMTSCNQTWTTGTSSIDDFPMNFLWKTAIFFVQLSKSWRPDGRFRWLFPRFVALRFTKMGLPSQLLGFNSTAGRPSCDQRIPKGEVFGCQGCHWRASHCGFLKGPVDDDLCWCSCSCVFHLFERWEKDRNWWKQMKPD